MSGADEGTSIYDDVRRNPQRPIPDTFKSKVAEMQTDLERELENLNTSLHSLAEKIGPILGPDYTEDSGEAENPTPEMSPMAAWIDGEISYVRNLRRRVEEYERRVEL